MTKKIVLIFEFDEKHYSDEECTDLILSKIRLGKSTTLTDDERSQITEEWGQSDIWHVDIHNDLLEVIDGSTVHYG